MVFSEEDKKRTIDRYTKRFNDFGYSQKAVGLFPFREHAHFGHWSRFWRFI
jgi:hypothetical protein